MHEVRKALFDVASGETKGTDRIAFLDYMRVYAFLAVLFWHKFPQFPLTQAHGQLADRYNAIAGAIWNGVTGVGVFFLVSGYIITHVVMCETPITFVIKRIFRIYPLFCAAVLAQYLILDHALPPWSELLRRLSLLGDFFGTPNTLWGVDWSLRFEILFYAYMAAHRLLLPKATLSLMLPAMAALIAIGCKFGPAWPIWNPLGRGSFNMWFPTLLLGSCIYIRQAFPRNIVAPITGIGILIVYPLKMPAVLIFTAAWCAQDILEPTRIVTTLSELSFSVYLLHYWFFDFIGWHFKQAPVAVRDGFSMIGLFAASYIFMIAVERPGIATGRRLSATVTALVRRRPEGHAVNDEAQLASREVAAGG